MEVKMSRLQQVLEKSALYSSILMQNMTALKEQQKAEFQRRLAEKKKSAKPKPTAKGRGRKGGKRARAEDEEEGESDGEGSSSKKRKGVAGNPVDDDVEEPPIFQQPALITGATLKNYQLEGLQWMVSLHQNGISGILGVCS